MVLKHAYTVSSESNSARPNDCGLLGSAQERLQLMSAPWAFKSLSNN